MSAFAYPVALDLTGRPCLVVGGGTIAERKVAGLVGAGARVTVVSPSISPELMRLATDGRLVQIGVQQGSKTELDLVHVMQKRLTVTGSTLRPRSVAEKGKIAAALRENVWPQIEAGSIRPIIHARLPLAEAREAHRIMEASAHIGKLVLLT